MNGAFVPVKVIPRTRPLVLSARCPAHIGTGMVDDFDLCGRVLPHDQPGGDIGHALWEEYIHHSAAYGTNDTQVAVFYLIA